jgi:hypothetical protein
MDVDSDTWSMSIPSFRLRQSRAPWKSQNRRGGIISIVVSLFIHIMVVTCEESISVVTVL